MDDNKLARLQVGVVLSAILTGCLDSPTNVSPAAHPNAHTERASSNEAKYWTRPQSIPIDAGDSFGALRIRYSPADAQDYFGSPLYGFSIDTKGLPGEAFYSLSAFRIEGNQLEWRVTSYGMGAGKVGIGVSPDGGDVELLIILTMHLPTPGVVRGAATISSEVSLPPESGVTAWHRTGYAVLSKYFSIGGSSPTAYGFEVAAPVPSPDLYSPPVLALESKHDSLGIEISSSFILGDVGVGAERLVWSVDDLTRVAYSPLAATPMAGFAAGHLAIESSTRESSLAVQFYGAAILPWIHIDHSTIQIDLESEGLVLSPIYEVNQALPIVFRHPMCYTARYGDICFAA